MPDVTDVRKTLNITNLWHVENITIKRATFIYAINSIRELVRLAQVVEQWTGNPEVGGSSPPSNHLIPV